MVTLVDNQDRKVVRWSYHGNDSDNDSDNLLILFHGRIEVQVRVQ